ncbi:unnamed protein product [Arabidopsis arenosa]|uniref:Replication protein A 70 kDa DNA-binding subunit B/D first OB fold domain-containing protein n=1 Tax=Arabidopsis arenosa TaxID=38785 RepID=A0A8S1ZHG2_ARAAE|nr:unnamed protein product [Arabidopsis arenosa]
MEPYPLSKLNPDTSEWRIRAKVLAIWQEYYDHYSTVDVVLVDDKGGKIHGIIPMELMPQFSSRIVENRWIVITDFILRPVVDALKPVAHRFELYEWVVETKVLCSWTRRLENSGRRLEFVLADREGNKIQCSLWGEVYDKFVSVIVSGGWFRIKDFKVVHQTGDCRATLHRYKMILLKNTTIVKIPDIDNNKFFDFVDFGSILDRRYSDDFLVDLIGEVVDVQTSNIEAETNGTKLHEGSVVFNDKGVPLSDEVIPDYDYLLDRLERYNESRLVVENKEPNRSLKRTSEDVYGFPSTKRFRPLTGGYKELLEEVGGINDQGHGRLGSEFGEDDEEDDDEEEEDTDGDEEVEEDVDDDEGEGEYEEEETYGEFGYDEDDSIYRTVSFYLRDRRNAMLRCRLFGKVAMTFYDTFKEQADGAVICDVAIHATDCTRIEINPDIRGVECFDELKSKNSLTFIDDINPIHDQYKIKVLILRLWKAYQKDAGNTIEMVLVDEKGSRIHATVEDKNIKKFDGVLKEGDAVTLNPFKLIKYSGDYKSNSLSFKILFYRTTQVKPCDDFPKEVPEKYFVEFGDVLNGSLDTRVFVDVIGQIVNVGPIEDIKIRGKSTPKLDVELRDRGNVRLMCTLWADFAKQVSELFAGSTVSIRDQFLVKNHKRTVRDIVEALEEGMCVTMVTVGSVERTTKWYYVSCKMCNKSVEPYPEILVMMENHLFTIAAFVTRMSLLCSVQFWGSVVHYCSGITVCFRYRLVLEVSDATNYKARFLLFDAMGSTLLRRTAQELYNEVSENDPSILPSEIGALVGRRFLFKVNKQNTNSTHISQTDECIVAIQQAASWVLPVDRLRGLFVMLMGVFCEADPLSVWDATWDSRRYAYNEIQNFETFMRKENSTFNVYAELRKRVA